MYNYLFSDKPTTKEEQLAQDEVKVSNIIKVSQTISGDWLKKEAEKKVAIQEQAQKHKEQTERK